MESAVRHPAMVAFALVSVPLTILSLPSLPGDIAGWGPWVAWVDDSPARWLLPVAGWLILGGLFVKLWRDAHRQPATGSLQIGRVRPRVRTRPATWDDIAQMRVPIGEGDPAITLRKAMREVAEGELNGLVRPRLEALRDSRATGMQLATAQWSRHEPLITTEAGHEAYQAATAAYGALRDLHRDLALEGRTQSLTYRERDEAAKVLIKVLAAIDSLREDTP